ncbi:MAG: hypothetical protein IKM66_06815 [Clostridia bacterium]|nr:hypothetical protein [Clostridia bacterium]
MDYNSESKLHPSIQILNLKKKLADTDYKAIKYAEGFISEEEYAPIKAERQRIRDKINELEKNIKITGDE